jgi:sodium-coupled neutral amino acid transporter 11
MQRNSTDYSLLDEDVEEIEMEPISIRSTIMDASFNFTNSIVGAGIIGLPYALEQSGFFVGIFLLGFLAWLVDYTVILLIRNAKLAGQSTYQGLIEFCFGSRGLLTISIFQFIFAYGALCAYTVILGDTIPTVFVSMLSKQSLLYPILTSRTIVIIFCTCFISLPLSLYRDISALAKTSAVSLAMICFIVLSVVFSSLSLPKELLGNPSLRFTFINDGVFEVIVIN